MPDLHLLRLAVDPAGLERLARARRFGDEDDNGYRLHALFAGLFGDVAPVPWRLDDRPQGRNRVVWAYTDQPWESLQGAINRRFEDPGAVGLDADLISLLRGALAWEGCASKSMPEFVVGQRMACDLRACATVRVHGDLPGIPAGSDHGAVAARKAGDEVDVVVAEALRRSRGGASVHMHDLDAGAIYAGWLRTALERLGGFTVEGIVLIGHRHVQVIRKHHAHGGRREVRLPEVVAGATLTIADPTAFRAALARGIGRHRAFGFGMLLLKPV